MQDLYNYINPKTKTHCPMISKDVNDIIQANATKFNSAIIYDRDYCYNYFGFKVVIACFHVMLMMIPSC